MTHRKQQIKMAITVLQHIAYVDCCCWT